MDKNCERHKRWVENNRDKVRAYKRKWYAKNKDNESKRKKEYFYKRFYNDSVYRSRVVARSIVHDAIYRDSPYKDGTRMASMIGCDYHTLKEHMLKTWKERYGKPYNGEKFNIDHITPLSSAKSEEEVERLCHYTNLQMLTPEDNALKSNKILFL